MDRTLRAGLFLIICALLWGSCSTTKRLADDEVLYTGVKKIKIESMVDEDVPGYVKSAVKDPLSVKPNNPLYSPYIRTPLPIGLWAYNYLYTERTTGFKAWLYRRLAKQPVLMDQDVRPPLRMDLVEDILDNLGYFGSTSDYELIPKKNPKKSRISYNVRVAEPWYYSSVSFPDIVCPVTKVIDSLKKDSFLQVGDQYNIDTLSAERIRITNALRNDSYYYFRPDYIEYLADTIRERLEVDLKMVLASGIPNQALQPYRVGDVEIHLFNPVESEMDSMYLDDIKLVYQKPLRLRPNVIKRMMRINPGAGTRVDSINTTLNNFTKLGVFRYVNIGVTPLDSLKAGDNLDMIITASLDSPIEAEFEADFSSKSNSFIGPGASFGIRHKNFLKGGEIFSVKANASYEWQTGNRRQEANSTAINSYELGLTTSLIFPRLVAPGFIHRGFKYDSKTTFQLGASILNRPKFFTMLSFNTSGSYDFQTSPRSFHNLTLYRIVYNRLLRTTEAFDSTMLQNPAIALSFENQFIPSSSYTYTYDRKLGKNNRDRLVWQSTAIAAGNLLSGIYEIFGTTGTKKIFGNQFSQFVKATTELKYYKQIGENNSLASRLMVGAGYAYGNSEVLPYSEQFYIGGANSIRAFTIRSIGPGSYRSPDGDIYGYFDQTGDFRLEANVEFRFGIAGNLKGAVFIDAGNIWLLKEDPLRPGGKLKFRNIWRELATGTGAGLRYDLSYLVIRADLGIGIHTPYKNPDKSGYYNISNFKDGLGFHLAIGYPF